MHPLQFMAAALTYAIAVNFFGFYRRPADMVGDSSIGLVNSDSPGPLSEADEKGNSSLKEGQIMDGAQVLEVEKQIRRVSLNP